MSHMSRHAFCKFAYIITGQKEILKLKFISSTELRIPYSLSHAYVQIYWLSQLIWCLRMHCRHLQPWNSPIRSWLVVASTSSFASKLSNSYYLIPTLFSSSIWYTLPFKKICIDPATRKWMLRILSPWSTHIDNL